MSTYFASLSVRSQSRNSCNTTPKTSQLESTGEHECGPRSAHGFHEFSRAQPGATVNLSAFSELAQILFSSYREGLLWLLITATPFGTAVLIRLYRGPRSLLFWTALLAAAVSFGCWVFELATFGDGPLSQAVSGWYLLFLYYSLPLWLVFFAVFGIVAFTYWKIVGPPEEDDEDSDSDTQR